MGRLRMRHENNFDVLRHIAAITVLVVHSFPLTGQSDPSASVFLYFGASGMAVDTFFFISGYLVTVSSIRRSAIEFVAARALRILPALFFAVLFCLVLGLLCTTLPAWDYITHPATRGYLGNIYVFGLQFRLPGVFEGLPHAGVNGSIWTIPLEVAMYIVTLALIMTRLNRSVWVYVVLAATFFGSFFVGVTQFDLGWTNQGPAILPHVRPFTTLHYGFFYLAGAIFSFWRPKPSMWVVLLAICLMVATVRTMPGFAIYFVVMPYLIYSLAFSGPFIKMPFGMDVSYGVYIYAFPIQQTIVHLFGAAIGPYWLTVTALPLTVVMAVLSWFLVEKKALALKDTVSGYLSSVQPTRPALDANEAG